MTLLRDGERLTGTYFYPKVGKNIDLSGAIDKDGNVSLNESDDSGKQTGVFKGKWKPATDSPDPALNKIDGKWSRPDGAVRGGSRTDAGTKRWRGSAGNRATICRRGPGRS